MTRTHWLRIVVLGVIVAVAALFIHLRGARGETAPSAGGDGSNGYRLASAWCRDCHAIERNAVNPGKKAPDFVAVANLPSTTALALKVFLTSNHPSMPNIVLKPDETNDLVAYILSLKRN